MDVSYLRIVPLAEKQESIKVYYRHLLLLGKTAKLSIPSYSVMSPLAINAISLIPSYRHTQILPINARFIIVKLLKEQRYPRNQTSKIKYYNLAQIILSQRHHPQSQPLQIMIIWQTLIDILSAFNYYPYSSFWSN